MVQWRQFFVVRGRTDDREYTQLYPEITRRIVNAANPVKVILFGSQARGTAHPGSDLDLLVIERDPVSARQEAIRLRRLLRDFEIPIDVEELTVFAVQFRYLLYREEQGFDRNAGLTLAEKFIEWADSIIELPTQTSLENNNDN